MKKSMVALCLLLMFAVAAVAQTPAKPSLYKRLGGYDAIAAVSDDFLGRLAADKQLSRFLAGRSEDNMKHLRQNFVDQVCAVTGGPCVYIGRDMKTTHKGMGITEADWTSAVNDLVATLDKFNVKGDERAELLAAVSSLKKDVVEKP